MGRPNRSRSQRAAHYQGGRATCSVNSICLGRDVDDQASQRCLTSFLKALDPWKLYFYQSDVDEFMKSQNELDDLAKKGDVTFAHKVFQVYLQRVDERVAVIDELLAMKHDFTVDEEMLTDRDMTSYPRTAAEARDRWRKRIKYSLLDLKVDGDRGPGGHGEAQPAIPQLRQADAPDRQRRAAGDVPDLAEHVVRSAHELHVAEHAGELRDHHAVWSWKGSGRRCKSEDGYTVIKKIIPGGAADKDGRLKLEDKIVGVGKDPQGEMVERRRHEAFRRGAR